MPGTGSETFLRPRVADGRDGLLSLSGQDLGRTGWVVIGQDKDRRVRRPTGEHERVHVDPVRAAAGPFGATVAHGFLTLSMLPVPDQQAA
jgi:acyl dehydratase